MIDNHGNPFISSDDLLDDSSVNSESIDVETVDDDDDEDDSSESEESSSDDDDSSDDESENSFDGPR